MPRVYRQQYTRAVPPGTPTKSIRGVPHIKRAGKWLPVHNGRITCTARVWYAEYRDGDGRLRVRSTKCTDESAARGVLADWVRRADLQRAGLISPSAAQAADHAADDLLPHVEAWAASMRSAGRSASHYKVRRYLLLRLAREIPWTRLGHLTYESFDKWMRGCRGLAARSRNGYRDAAISFGGWCVVTQRLAANPFTGYPKSNVAADRRRIRRAFTGEELSRLIAAAETRSPARALAYRVLALTGLRVGELRSLLVRDLHGSVLHLGAKHEKSRRGSVIPLRSDLAALLAEWVKGRAPASPLIPIPTQFHRRLRGDLAAAGITSPDAEGAHLDAHALRYTYATALATAGVAPRVAQEAMRHSSPDLTARVYQDPRLLQVAAAVETIDLLREKNPK